MSPTFQQPKTLQLRRQPKYPRKGTPGRYKLDRYVIFEVPLTMERTDGNTLVLTGMSRPTSTKSNGLWRSSETLTWLRSTSWSGLMGRRRHVSDWSWWWCCQQIWDHPGLPWWLSRWRARLPVQEMQKKQVRSLGTEDPGEGNGNLLQDSWLENFMDKRAWTAPVHEAAKR